MTQTTPPDEWSEKSEAVPGPDQAYVYSVGDDARVLVGLASPSNDAEETRLEVSSIEESGRLKRHDFVVETYEEEQVGAEQMTSLMRFLAERLHKDTLQDERLFIAVNRCIEEFESRAQGRRR